MGLKENRIIQTIKEENIPSNKFMLKDHFGIEMEFDVNFDEWKSGYEAVLNLNGYVLGQATEAVGQVARDDMGKQAIQESVKTIKAVRVDSPDKKELKLEDGALVLYVAPEHGWDGVFGKAEITEFLTENL